MSDTEQPVPATPVPSPPPGVPVRHTAVAMLVICAAQFVLQLDFSIVNVALPTIQRELHVAPADLLAGLASMAAGQLWLGQVSAGDSYPAGVLPGLILTALGVGLGLPTASVAITAGVRGRDQGLAGALFTTSQQTGAAVGLAVLATAAAARTAHAGGSLVAGYRLSFLIGAGIAVLAAALVAVQLRTRRSGPQPAAK